MIVSKPQSRCDIFLPLTSFNIFRAVLIYRVGNMERSTIKGTLTSGSHRSGAKNSLLRSSLKMYFNRLQIYDRACKIFVLRTRFILCVPSREKLLHSLIFTFVPYYMCIQTFDGHGV